jgi:hypothetical protein
MTEIIILIMVLILVFWLFSIKPVIPIWIIRCIINAFILIIVGVLIGIGFKLVM